MLRMLPVRQPRCMLIQRRNDLDGHPMTRQPGPWWALRRSLIQVPIEHCQSIDPEESLAAVNLL